MLEFVVIVSTLSSLTPKNMCLEYYLVVLWPTEQWRRLLSIQITCMSETNRKQNDVQHIAAQDFMQDLDKMVLRPGGIYSRSSGIDK